MNMRRVWSKKATFFIVCITMIILALGCSKKQDSNVSVDTVKSGNDAGDKRVTKENEKKELKIVRIAAPGSNGELLENGKIAQKLGYIDEELEKVGYKVEYKGFAGAGPAINEAYGSKEIDLAVYGDLPNLVAINNDIDIKVFAAVNTDAHFGILVQNDSDIKSSADLEGKKVIVAKGTTAHKYFEDLVVANHLDESKINVVNAVADAQTIFASKEADALPTALYSVYYYESLGLGKVIETSEEHDEWSCQYFFSGRREYLTENPLVAEAIIRALKRAQDYIKNNPKQYGLLLAQEGGINAEAYQKANSFDETFGNLSPELTDASFDKVTTLIKFATENGLIAKELKVEDVIDTSYYETVKAENNQ